MCKYVWLVWQKDDVRNGAFELFSPWWMTPTTFCAAIPTESVAFAKSVVASSHSKTICEHDMRWLAVEVHEGSPFSAAFPRAEWMFWPGDVLFVDTATSDDFSDEANTPETTRASSLFDVDCIVPEFLPNKNHRAVNSM